MLRGGNIIISLIPDSLYRLAAAGASNHEFSWQNYVRMKRASVRSGRTLNPIQQNASGTLAKL
ncbi:MAG TPA: hypothetical protein VIW67_12980, partial [Terriglobales bacterium]